MALLNSTEVKYLGFPNQSVRAEGRQVEHLQISSVVTTVKPFKITLLLRWKLEAPFYYKQSSMLHYLWWDKGAQFLRTVNVGVKGLRIVIGFTLWPTLAIFSACFARIVFKWCNIVCILGMIQILFYGSRRTVQSCGLSMYQLDLSGIYCFLHLCAILLSTDQICGNFLIPVFLQTVFFLIF